MNIYFTASIVGKRKYKSDYVAIIDFLKKQGHIVQSNHIIDTTEDQIRLQTRKEREDFHKKLEDWITKADCMVVEASYPSISVGYEIALAQHLKKPVLALYKMEYPPNILSCANEENIICEQYSKSSLSGILEDFLNYVGTSQDSRFTFFITPKIGKFLDDISKKQNMPKSVYLRRLIEREMKG